MYTFFFFLNFNPQNIPAKNRGRLGWVSFIGHLLPMRMEDLPTPATPSPLRAWKERQGTVGRLQRWLGWSQWEAGMARPRWQWWRHRGCAAGQDQMCANTTPTPQGSRHWTHSKGEEAEAQSRGGPGLPSCQET